MFSINHLWLLMVAMNREFYTPTRRVFSQNNCAPCVALFLVTFSSEFILAWVVAALKGIDIVNSWPGLG